MRKSAVPIDSPEAARDAIRGTTALVDGLRAVYALWADADQRGKPGTRFKGAVVKANGPASRYVRAYERDAASGLLVDRTEDVANERDAARERVDDAIVELVRQCQLEGRPITRTGARGVYTVGRNASAALGQISRTVVEAHVDRLVKAGFLVIGTGQDGRDLGCLYASQA